MLLTHYADWHLHYQRIDLNYYLHYEGMSGRALALIIESVFGYMCLFSLKASFVAQDNFLPVREYYACMPRTKSVFVVMGVQCSVSGHFYSHTLSLSTNTPLSPQYFRLGISII